MTTLKLVFLCEIFHSGENKLLIKVPSPHTFSGYFCKTILRKRCKSHFEGITKFGEGEGRDFLSFLSKLLIFVSGGECFVFLLSRLSILLNLGIHICF